MAVEARAGGPSGTDTGEDPKGVPGLEMSRTWKSH
jgi:hypothetical protein